MAGFPPYERGSGAARKRLYSAAMTERTYDRILTAAETELQKGHSVILDATFARRAQRELLAVRFGKRGITWRLLEAQASNAAVKQRLEDFGMLTRLYEPPTEFSAGQCAKVHTSGPLDQTVTKALRSLAGLQVERSAYQRE